MRARLRADAIDEVPHASTRVTKLIRDYMLRALVIGRAGSHLFADVAVFDIVFLALAAAMPGIAVAHLTEDRLADRRYCLGNMRSHDALALDLACELLDNGGAELFAMLPRRMFNPGHLLPDPAQDLTHAPALCLAQPRSSLLHDIPPLG